MRRTRGQAPRLPTAACHCPRLFAVSYKRRAGTVETCATAHSPPFAMKALHTLFTVVHALIALLFSLAAIALLWIAGLKGWNAMAHGVDGDSGLRIVEALGILASGVVALQIAQTITEEEVIREAHISGPTRVRRFLSRFLVVLVVALAVEALVAAFKTQEEPAHLLYPAALVSAVGVLLLGWGAFIHLNRSAEELEPEAMEQAKGEDHKVNKD